jgi:ketosteroid isomerase-like protein
MPTSSKGRFVVGAAENAKAVRGAYEAFLQDDVGPMVSLMSDEVHITNYEGNAFAGDYQGQSGFAEYMATLDLTDFEGLEVESVLAEEDRVVAVLTTQYTVKATGKPAGGLTIHVMDFADDKIVRFREVAADDGDAWKS